VSDADRIEETIAHVALDLFGGQLAFILSVLARLGDDPVPRETVQRAIRIIVVELESAELYDEWVERFDDALRPPMLAGVETITAQIGVRFNLRQSRLDDAISGRAQQLAGYVGQTTADGVLRVLKESTDAGEGVRQLARRIHSEVFGGEITRARAELIAKQETRTARATGQYLAASTTPTLAYKRWNHWGNPKEPRDWHVDMDGETVPIDALFSNGLRYSCDPDGEPEETINCGCVTTYLSRAELDVRKRRKR
jgi:hypothetical protein